jgi:hypothetical protein
MKSRPSLLPRTVLVALLSAGTVFAQVVYTDFADIRATGTGQAIAVHFGDGQGGSGSVNSFTFSSYANQATIPADALNFYWHDGLIVVHANSSGFTGLNYNANPPGYYGILEADRLDAGEMPGASFANDLRIIANKRLDDDNRVCRRPLLSELCDSLWLAAPYLRARHAHLARHGLRRHGGDSARRGVPRALDLCRACRTGRAGVGCVAQAA